MKTIKVKIIKSEKGAWYQNKIGKIFIVNKELQTIESKVSNDHKEHILYELANDSTYFIRPKDCIIIGRKQKLERILK